MNILIIDQFACGLDIALRAKGYGHSVRLYTRHNKDGSRCETGDGLVPKVKEWEPSMNWADLIFVTDNTLYIRRLEEYRDKGYPIFGCNIEGQKWEQDRIYGDDVMKRAGIETIPMERFSKYEEAIAYVLENKNKRYVCKPIGDGKKDLSYCSKDWRDMTFMLNKWSKSDSYKGEFVIQEFHAGHEMGCGGWFGMDGFSKNITESWEHKKLMSGEHGPTTGEMGTIVRYTNKSKLFDMVLKPLEGMLHGIGYTGYIDVNTIIDEHGCPWPLEFTSRPGWPLFSIQQSLHVGDPVEWMLDLIEGRDTLKVSSKIACGVVAAQPDFPYNRMAQCEVTGYPLFDMTEEDGLDHIHYSEVKMGVMPNESGKMKAPCLVTCGTNILTFVGLGKTICEAHEEAHALHKKKIHLINSPMIRDDIGEKVEKMLPDLHKHGYATGVK
jgi:phosphoribosylamine--glycine ligase